VCACVKGIRTIESEETAARSSLAASEKQIEHLTVVSPCLCKSFHCSLVCNVTNQMLWFAGFLAIKICILLV